MIALIRIRSSIGLEKKKKDALDRLMLRKKYCCVLLPEKELPKVLNVKDHVIYGKINEKTLRKLLAERGRKNNKPLSSINDELLKSLMEEKTNLKKEGLKPYFNLHPPRGGFKKSTKLAYPKGVLGKNEKINEIIMQML